jgi:hypothetical protein
MKIVLSDSTEIPIVLNNTNFVDYWVNKKFNDVDNINLTVEQSQCNRVIDEFNAAWSFFNNTVNQINSAIESLHTEQTLNRKMLFPLSNEPTVGYLEKIHEQWAAFTKDSTVYELETWSQLNLDTYHDINNSLKAISCHYDDINWAVHRLEFLYKYLLLTDIIITDAYTFPKDEYKISAADTTFDRQQLMIPFYDIGRPQFEKWGICKRVVHEEISNYNNISNRLHIRIEKASITPPSDYVTDCNIAGVEVFGPNLGLGNFGLHNVDEVGFLLVKEILGNNNIRMVR